MIEFDKLHDNQTVYAISEDTVMPVAVSPIMQDFSLTQDQIPCRRFSFKDGKEGMSKYLNAFDLSGRGIIAKCADARTTNRTRSQVRTLF